MAKTKKWTILLTILIFTAAAITGLLIGRHQQAEDQKEADQKLEEVWADYSDRAVQYIESALKQLPDLDMKSRYPDVEITGIEINPDMQLNTVYASMGMRTAKDYYVELADHTQPVLDVTEDFEKLSEIEKVDFIQLCQEALVEAQERALDRAELDDYLKKPKLDLYHGKYKIEYFSYDHLRFSSDSDLVRVRVGANIYRTGRRSKTEDNLITLNKNAWRNALKAQKAASKKKTASGSSSGSSKKKKYSSGSSSGASRKKKYSSGSSGSSSKKKSSSGSGSSGFDKDDYDVEGFYEDHKDIYDSYEDAYDDFDIDDAEDY